MAKGRVQSYEIVEEKHLELSRNDVASFGTRVSYSRKVPVPVVPKFGGNRDAKKAVSPQPFGGFSDLHLHPSTTLRNNCRWPPLP